ncbi:GAF domain-containing protein [Salinibacter altiplanensis]|uniref:GAF domain-containing protein n=1 Tax=Salinibacter altiplanensis TaxID=1803181 RepID=UPI000C9F4F4B|nr:GAF domain-containing protein [Salinibacter altiplanensis]
MEASHHTSNLDPSSVLGFGSALALLDSTEEVARLLTGALRSMGLADLQAVILTGTDGEAPCVLGSTGTHPLPDPVVDELRHGLPFDDAADEGTAPSSRRVAVPAESALAAQGIDRLATARLGTLDQEFGVAVAGLVEGHTHTPLEQSSLQMMAAQTSMALHRIELDQERASQAEALRESEARYRELYENAPVAYVSATAEGEIRMANRRATELFDVPETALVGRSIPNFCADTPKGREAGRRLEERLRSGAPVRDDEVELCRLDGTRIWVSLTMRPIEADDDRNDRLIMMVDVTERRRMQAALREARDELEDRVNARTAELEQANKRLEQRTQRLKALRNIDQAILAAESPEEIASATLRRIRRIVPFTRASVSVIDWEADRAHVLATRQDDEVLAGGTTMPLDDFYMTDALRAGETDVIPDLADRPHSGTAETVQDLGVRSVLCIPMTVGEDLMGILKVGRAQPDAFTDMDHRVGAELATHLAIALRQARLQGRVEARTTELEQANERLAHQAHRLRTLRNIDQAILAAESPEEIATVAIRRVRDILPYKSATVTDADWDAGTARVLAAEDNVLDPPATLPLEEIYLSDALRAGETEVLSRADYAPVPEAQARMDEMGLQSILCVPMVVEDEVIGIVHVGRSQPDAFTDDDWRIGRELADHMAVALRQSRLLEEVQTQREQLEERVQERTEELESFTYSVSHDLRTPLRAIDGYTRILKEDHADQLGEEGQRLLNVVYESAQTMGTLIDDLLTLSRLGRHEMTHGTIDMEALARETIDEVRRAHDVAAETFNLAALPDAAGDRSMLRHVFSNLFSNAVKFTQNEDSPQIDVHGEVRDGTCVYAVNDNGVGFAPARAEELFGVFERAHEADAFEGTGVGLAVVERIVRRHDGRAWAEGREGEGASFFFSLPPPEAAS